ncbi:TRI59 protein, partial [Thryothorus ludovicianus]|nr:TRI59 protein [Thryothorus ludovicianus]
MERLEEELTCAICCDIFSEPRVLPCSHTFCLPCLRELLQPRPAARSLSCPSCRAQLPVPAGPEALPINFALKAVIDKWRQREPAGTATATATATGMCREHSRQPLNIYCVQDRRLVCGQCVTIGSHRGHAIDDLQSAHGKGRKAWGQLLQELEDPSRSEVFSCSQRLQDNKARCQSALQSDREAVLRYFKELGDALEQKKAALLSALDELESSISEKYDPLIEEVEKLKAEEGELKELHSAVREEESPLLFLEKLDGLQLRLQALKHKQLPGPEPVEIHPRMQQVLQDTWSKTAIGQLHEIQTPKLQLAPKNQFPPELTPASALRAVFADPKFLLMLVVSFVPYCIKEFSSGAVPAPLQPLWLFLLHIYEDSCSYLQDRVQELC